MRAEQDEARRCYVKSLETRRVPNRDRGTELRIHSTELDPRIDFSDRRPQPTEELKIVQIGDKAEKNNSDWDDSLI
ncbi:hypothetical protein SESBI_45815 [Sesbania bispinosa]|nr:hypothetical protein SESBI_45815 [Sesbania bispinosa]